MIPRHTIQQVLDTARIEEVVGDFVRLKKRGVNQIGNCPFHNEKTPSFTVSPAKGIFKCFGCGEAGSSVDFVMKHEHLTFPQAVHYLAKKYNIEIEEEAQSQEQIQAETERESLMSVTQFAARYFTEQLHQSPEGQAVALSYFNERGFRPEVIKIFQLGYSPESWDALSSAALAAGYSKELLLKTGLSIEKDNGQLYDRFRQRVMFPIHSVSGRTIGFGGRILTSDKNKPKYVNSPESSIYDKSNVLFGLFTAKNAILKHDNCFLVEGYTDVISLFQSGIENVVSSSGTSLTTGQIKLIKRYTPNITILYDGDAAGIKASFRGIDMILEEGMNVRVVLFPQGEDPDSYARTHSSSEMLQFLQDQTTDFIHFKADLLSSDAGNDPIKKASVVREIVTSIALVPEQLNRLFFIRETSELLQVQEEMLVSEVAKIRRRAHLKTHPEDQALPELPTPQFKQEVAVPEIDTQLFEKEMIRLMLNYGKLMFNPAQSGIEMPESDSETSISVVQFILDELHFDQEMLFENPLYKQFLEEYQTALQSETLPSEQYFTQHTDENIRKAASELLSTPYNISPNWLDKHKIEIQLETHPEVISRACIGTVYDFKIRKVKKWKKEIEEKLSHEEPDELSRQALLQKWLTLKTFESKLNATLGRIITGG